MGQGVSPRRFSPIGATGGRVSRLARGWYHADADRFSQLQIYTALQALAVNGPQLWDRYDQGNNLLFREADLQQPATSAVLRELWRSPNGLVRDLAGNVILALQGDVEKVRALEPLVDAIRLAVGGAARLAAL